MNSTLVGEQHELRIDTWVCLTIVGDTIVGYEKWGTWIIYRTKSLVCVNLCEHKQSCEVTLKRVTNAHENYKGNVNEITQSERLTTKSEYGSPS